MKKIAAVLSFTCSLAVGMAATPALAATPEAAPAAAASSAALDPATVKAVRELLDSMDYRKLVGDAFSKTAAQMPQMMRSGAEAAVRGTPNLSDAERAKRLADVDKRLAKIGPMMTQLFNDPTLIDDMIEEIVPLYARHFTADEMRQLAAFYRTPVGAKALEKMPLLMSEGMKIGQKVVEPRVQKLMRDLQPN
ncbi:DUF2059 domain-containing protein [Pseudoduganella armeniaca]|uniref:DUF2059 domain-containing protein n=1 Tax=Pseudoduganella armeniaca TaxID=2072590 RepID=A0A2R4C8J1_9BURK|nr:DUF2059 domain-containing protein [Pseudoduganella armeniaca]AVR95901.1 DUF2059 domain-containing protein [Pseudoduganella armeniaca]